MEANLAAIEVGRARARVLTAERELSASRQELQRLTGIDRAVVVVAREEGDLPAGPNAGTLDPDSILQMALSRRPDLEARARAAEHARALTALARREAIPNLEIGALARRETPGTESRFGIGVRLSVPLWNRNQGLIRERRAMTRQVELEHRAVALAIGYEVQTAILSYQAASAEARIYADEVLQPARANQELLEIAYREGKIGLATLLLLRNQLLDAEFGYWDAWLAKRGALAQLQAATGELGSDIDVTDQNGASNDR